MSSTGLHDGQMLQELLQTTEAMLGHADRLEWEQVDRLHAQRSVQLQDGLGNNDSAFDVENTRDALASLLTLNDQLVKRVTQARNEILQESRKLQASRSAAGDYQSIQAGQHGTNHY